MPFGAALLPAGGTQFRLWAPSSARVELELQTDLRAPRRIAMRATDGWHEAVVADAAAGSRYRYWVQGRDGHILAVPDPASRFNPDGVHGASVIVDPQAFAWRHAEWRGRTWPESILYELHVGTFTREGTFAAARDRLADLSELGITAVELLPLAAFTGKRGWGYDGVLQFAPAACYGRPEELKSFVDAAHGFGMMVLLDVVYNHFGPDGNYLHAYCPEFFNDARPTPWGSAVNFDGAQSATVRDFFIHNALYWVEEYRFDGLRLDAVDAFFDTTSPDIVSEIATALQHATRERRARVEVGRARQVHLILENSRNQADYLRREPSGRTACATAQWNDDVHHALHVLLGGERGGYYDDFAITPLEQLGRALAEGFAYQGEYSSFRGAHRGTRSAALPPAAFLNYLQNHDMVGNRPWGDRVTAYPNASLLPTVYACLLLAPPVPMLFMGEEYAASTPFLYFCDLGADLGASVAAGRRRDLERFAGFDANDATARIPDPNEAVSFTSSKLNWAERLQPPHREHLALMRRFIELRHLHLDAHLAGIRHGGRFEVHDGLLRVEWDLWDGTVWGLMCNFATAGCHTTAWPAGDVIYTHGVERAAGAVQIAAGGVLVLRAAAALILTQRPPAAR